MTSPAPSIHREALPMFPGLGRNIEHDQRSLAFAIPVLPKSAIKPVAWSRAVPIFDQKQVGSCTGNAAAGWIATDDSLRKGLTINPLDQSPVDEDLALRIYSAAEDIDGDGPYPPNDNGSTGLSVSKVLEKLNLISSYLHGFSLSAVYSGLQSGPGLLGIPWYNSMFEPDSTGRITVNLRTKMVGGHEILIDQIEVDKSGAVTRIWITNSWGSGWGQSGRAWFAPEDLQALLSNQGDFVLPVASVPSPIPSPVPVPGNVNRYLVYLSDQVNAKVIRNANKHAEPPETYLESIINSRFHSMQSLVAWVTPEDD